MFYKLPERADTARGYKHHENVLPNIIGDSKARNVASTYIYRAPFKEKMVITKMLNEWNKPELGTGNGTNEVIRPKAATVIKDWLTHAKEEEARVAEKFLTHLKEVKRDPYNKPRATKSATFRRVFQREQPQAATYDYHPIQDTPRYIKNERDIDKMPKKRRPVTSRPLTYGTFYPEYGHGNNTGIFNVVPTTPRYDVPQISPQNTQSQPQVTQYEEPKIETDIDRMTKRRKERPKTAGPQSGNSIRPLTSGSFYPEVGYGNNTGVFNIVPPQSTQRSGPPATPPQQIQQPSPQQQEHQQQQQQQQQQPTTEPEQVPEPPCQPDESDPQTPRRPPPTPSSQINYCPPPINRSSVFEAVSLPSARYSQYSQPNLESRPPLPPSSQKTGEELMLNGIRGEAVVQNNRGGGGGGGGGGGKLKFSAHMQQPDGKPSKQVTVSDDVEVASEATSQSQPPQLRPQPPQQPRRQQQQQQESATPEMSVVQAQVHAPSATTNSAPTQMLTCRCQCLAQQQQQQQQSQPQPQQQPPFRAQPQPLLPSRHVAQHENQNVYTKGNFFNVLSMGGFGRPDIGTAGRRGYPGRRYDQHFTLG